MQLGLYRYMGDMPCPFFTKGKDYELTGTQNNLKIKEDDTGSFHPVTGGWVQGNFIYVPQLSASLDGGGLRHDTGKPRLELIPPEALMEEARVWEYGAKKYSDYNWARGMAWTKVLGCILRHTMAIVMGEDRDKETGLLHAAHIRCNAAMLIYYFEHYKQGDDRHKRPEKKDVKDSE